MIRYNVMSKFMRLGISVSQFHLSNFGQYGIKSAEYHKNNDDQLIIMLLHWMEIKIRNQIYNRKNISN